jgi:hypothetical protein
MAFDQAKAEALMPHHHGKVEPGGTGARSAGSDVLGAAAPAGRSLPWNQ